MIVKHLQDIPCNEVAMEGAAGVFRQLPIGSGDGAPLFSFRVFTIEPGGNTPYHTHAWEHVNYIISGSGALVDPDGRETPITAGDFALVPPEEKHCYKNTGTAENLVMICAVPKEHE